jgi:SOS-response transcriptional repressor LexA
MYDGAGKVGAGLSEQIARISDRPTRRDEALAYIIETIARHGTAPTFDEIGRHLGTSKSRAREYVTQLTERGLVERTPGAQRNIRVVNVAQSRDLLVMALQRMGWITTADQAAGATQSPAPALAILPSYGRPADEDLPGAGDLIAALDRAA